MHIMEDLLARKEIEGQDEASNIIYDPTHFIRCHGKNNIKAPADTNTQIWDAAFEPNSKCPEMSTNNLATCGGNSICIINILSGEVLMKYSHQNTSEDFYTLDWTLIPCEDGSNKSILASGSVNGEICLFYPEKKVCFKIWPLSKSLNSYKLSNKKRKRSGAANISINSIVFHSIVPTWLFIALGNGLVYLYDIGSSFILPKYSGVKPEQLLKLEPNLGEIYNIIWTGNNSKWLMAGTKDGLVGWNIEESNIVQNENELPIPHQPTSVYFKMPKCSREKVDGAVAIVDSLTKINEWTLVSKCVLHGSIYVIDLAKTVEGPNILDQKAVIRSELVQKQIKLFATLDWSKTDAYYMNIGCNSQGLICCGDDIGSLWVYDQPQFGIDVPKESNNELPIKADVRLMWPDLQDERLENAEVHPEKARYDIIVDKVVISQDGEHIVAVTSNNMICIWRRRRPMRLAD